MVVRKVTQDNRGKKTAGIDGVKLLSLSQRISLTYKLKIDGQCNLIKCRLTPNVGNPISFR